MEKAGVIIAGGSGTRFWPVSRNNNPKQYLRLFGKKTLIQAAVERNQKVFGKNIFVCTNPSQKKVVQEQTGLPENRFVLEPLPRDTAAAMGLSAIRMLHEFGNCVMGVFWSDHLINDIKRYQKSIEFALACAEKSNDIIKVGVPPTYPATALGYLELGEQKKEGLWKEKQHKEKPDKKTAEKYVNAGNFVWNAGLFAFKAGVMLNAIKEHLPEHYTALEKIKEANFDETVTRKLFEKMEKISIDYGVLEKVHNVGVVKAEFDWDDVGSWNALERVVSQDPQNNAIKGKFFGLESNNNIIFSDNGMIATIGMQEMVIVKSGNAILVCKKSDVEKVKTLVEQLKKNEKMKPFM